LIQAVLWLTASSLVGGVACKADPPGRQAAAVVPPALASSAPVRPPPPVQMPGAIAHAEGHPARPEAAQATAQVKYSGALGDRLEGDVYYFQLRSLRTCDPEGKVAGVEVEIEAKSKLALNPRDVVIGKGGIQFKSNLDFERKLPGCTPLLKVSILQKGQVARGFVLYDLPARPGDDLRLIYQPTRWGGAGHVTAALKDWSPVP
jgi:hypothetical protein